MKKFRKVAVGGTFDEFHKGHKVLLIKAFEIGEHVLIGLCTDEFVEKMGKPHVTAPYEERLKDIEALVVSEETEKTALKINQKRSEAQLPPLTIITINMVPAENYKPISTTRIREGEIDREGHLLKRSRKL